MAIRDRVKELRRVRVGDLKENSGNWRRHPKTQIDALAGVIAEVGFAGALIAYEDDDGGLTLIDGHMRAGVSADQELPVVVLDVNEDEAKKLLAVNAMLEALANGERMPLPPLGERTDPLSEWDGMPEFEQEDQMAWKRLFVNFANEEDLNHFAQLIGQSVTDRTKSVWYPEAEKHHEANERYIVEDESRLPS